MSNLMQKLISPDYYKTQWTKANSNMYNYYHPLFKAGSVKPLFHMILFTSVVMYSTTYIFFKRPKIEKLVDEREKALKEYRAVHGDPSAHH